MFASETENNYLCYSRILLTISSEQMVHLPTKT